jgi:hypothetical protein
MGCKFFNEANRGIYFVSLKLCVVTIVGIGLCSII